MQFTQEHGGKLPRDATEFEQFASRALTDYLREQSLTIEDVLTSPRDGEPYVIVSQAKPAGRGSTLAIYETTGQDGLRYVADRSGSVFEADSAAFAQLESPP